MARTVIDLDDDLVAEVAKALGTRTKKDTVNPALREVLENRRRALGAGRANQPRQHRSAGPVDPVLAATAELHGLTLLHQTVTST